MYHELFDLNKNNLLLTIGHFYLLHSYNLMCNKNLHEKSALVVIAPPTYTMRALRFPLLRERQAASCGFYDDVVTVYEFSR